MGLAYKQEITWLCAADDKNGGRIAEPGQNVIVMLAITVALDMMER